MNRSLLAGLGVVIAIAGLVLWSNQDSRLILDGSIKKVRSTATSDGNAIVAADFRFSNPAAYPFQVKLVEMFLEDATGKRETGTVLRQVDVKPVFEFYKLGLGEVYNPSVFIGETFASKAMEDRMVAATFPVKESVVDSRKRVLIRITPVNGATPTEIAEER
jgi:hypothetical protein